MIKYQVFKKVYIDHRKAMNQWGTKSLKSMQRIGAMLMRESQKGIKRRIVTDNMRGRLRAAQEKGNKTAVKRIFATIQKRQAETSKPGQPPVAHVPDAPFRSIRDIRFAATKNSVLVGPSGGNGRRLIGSNRVTVPEILEKGGIATITEVSSDRGKTWTRKDGRRSLRPWQKARKRKVVYRPRPNMGPTLKRTTPKQQAIIAKVFGKG